MLKNVVLLLGIGTTIIFQSCSEPTHPDAQRLCDCYTQMYRATENEMDAVADSCSGIYIDIINTLKDNPEEKAKFEEAYAACQ